MSQVYNIAPHNFKGYIPFIVVIKYWLCSLCCVLYPHSLSYLDLQYLYLLIPNPMLPPFPLPAGNHLFAICSCKSAAFLLYN